jgi:hypothetical protein
MEANGNEIGCQVAHEYISIRFISLNAHIPQFACAFFAKWLVKHIYEDRILKVKEA